MTIFVIHIRFVVLPQAALWGGLQAVKWQDIPDTSGQDIPDTFGQVRCRAAFPPEPPVANTGPPERRGAGKGAPGFGAAKANPCRRAPLPA